MSSPRGSKGDNSTTDPRRRVKSHSITGMMDNDPTSLRPHQQMTQLSPDEKCFLLYVERGDVRNSRKWVTFDLAFFRSMGYKINSYAEDEKFDPKVLVDANFNTKNYCLGRNYPVTPITQIGRVSILQNNLTTGTININCADPLGRSALLMAIDNENLGMVELLLEFRVETRDALLHAISEEYVEAVEVLLEHEDAVHKPGEPHSWEALPPDTASFTPDITPLILAAHRDNYEIIKLLLDRGATLPMPHDIRCGCEECVTSRLEDSLRHSRSRINAYRALASPSLIALSSKDPILTAFELSWELRRLFFAEHEFKAEYMDIKGRMDCFATALLDHTRGSYELEVLLNHDPTGPAFEHGERMHLNRLKLAIKFRQKKFVAHPNVQQLLASIWYEGLPGFRRKNMLLQALEVIRIGLLFPLFSLCYILAPKSGMGQTLRKPFIKFICHSASYFTFLFLLILASQRFEAFVVQWLGSESLSKWVSTDVTTKRGAPPSFVEWFILAWVTGLIWSEIKQLWDVGLQEYVGDMWNILDFVTNSLYVATICLRIVAHYQVQKEKEQGALGDLAREDWHTWDPMLIAEGLFAAANIFSSLKLVYIFSVNPYLGPLQISLGRMVMDIMKFFFLYILVLFAFSCGMNQLLWYYADLEKKRCEGLREERANNSIHTTTNFVERDPDSCHLARRFSNLFEGSQSLFWAVFGLIELESFELAGIKSFTRFWGLLMFGCFSVINIVVLLNLLIAMMNHSYQLIFEKADVEWKFARSKLWISYFEEGGTVPPPFNIIPTPKSICYILRWTFKKICRFSTAAKREHIRTIRRKVIQQSERDFRYQNIMRNLVRRYVTSEQRQADNQGVTEDDVNEIKQDISAFRCELMDVLRDSGLKVKDPEGLGTGSGGKKNRQRERRLMKGFNISTAAPPSYSTSLLLEVAELEIEQDPDAVHYDKRSPKTKLARLAKKAGAKREMSKRKWGTIIEAAKNAGMSKLVGRSRSEDSVCSNCSQGSTQRQKLKQQSTDPSGSISSINRENTGTSTIGRKKREGFARSRPGGVPVPLSMHFARFRLRDGGGQIGVGIMSQSLDAGERSEEGSFEEVKFKRTSSAPSREGSTSPPPPNNVPSTSGNSIFAITSAALLAETAQKLNPLKSHVIPVQVDKTMEHICVEVDEEPSQKLNLSPKPSKPIRPNGSNKPGVGSKLQGLQGIQPVKSSATSSGWL